VERFGPSGARSHGSPQARQADGLFATLAINAEQHTGSNLRLRLQQQWLLLLATDLIDQVS